MGIIIEDDIMKNAACLWIRVSLGKLNTAKPARYLTSSKQTLAQIWSYQVKSNLVCWELAGKWISPHTARKPIQRSKTPISVVVNATPFSIYLKNPDVIDRPLRSRRYLAAHKYEAIPSSLLQSTGKLPLTPDIWRKTYPANSLCCQSNGN